MKPVHLSRGKPTLLSYLKVPAVLLSHPPTGTVGKGSIGAVCCVLVGHGVCGHCTESGKACFFLQNSQWEKQCYTSEYSFSVEV